MDDSFASRVAGGTGTHIPMTELCSFGEGLLDIAGLASIVLPVGQVRNRKRPEVERQLGSLVTLARIVVLDMRQLVGVATNVQEARGMLVHYGRRNHFTMQLACRQSRRHGGLQKMQRSLMLEAWVERCAYREWRSREVH